MDKWTFNLILTTNPTFLTAIASSFLLGSRCDYPSSITSLNNPAIKESWHPLTELCSQNAGWSAPYRPWVAPPISKINVQEFQIDKVSQSSHGLADGKAGNEQLWCTHSLQCHLTHACSAPTPTPDTYMCTQSLTSSPSHTWLQCHQAIFIPGSLTPRQSVTSDNKDSICDFKMQKQQSKPREIL